MFTITEAVREQSCIKLYEEGASGTGKTASALKLAYGLAKGNWKKIGIIDTEHNRSKKYVNTNHIGLEVGSFLHIDMKPPYTPDRFKGAVKALADAGCEVIIIDSLTHLWNGEGGMQDIQQTLGGQFKHWKEAKAQWNSVIKDIMYTDTHFIVTGRMKMKHTMQPDEHGKQQVVKLGVESESEKDIDYEFDISLQIDRDHKVTINKDMTGLFEKAGRFQIEVEHGEMLGKWANEGIRVKTMAEIREEQEQIRVKHAKTLRDYANKFEDIKTKIVGFEYATDKKLEQFDQALLDLAVKRLYEEKLVRSMDVANLFPDVAKKLGIYKDEDPQLYPNNIDVNLETIDDIHESYDPVEHAMAMGHTSPEGSNS